MSTSTIEEKLTFITEKLEFQWSHELRTGYDLHVPRKRPSRFLTAVQWRNADSFLQRSGKPELTLQDHGLL